MLRLRIKLEGALCPGTGIGRPGIVDREVVFDELGLPYLPGRRIKGLLRDAYEQLCAAPGLDDAGLPAADALFGAVGQTEPGAVAIGNARLMHEERQTLEEAERVAKWIRAAESDWKVIYAEDIRERFTEIRRQTSIDRKTGAAAENTLRFTRVLSQGLVFCAPIGDLSTDLRQALSLAAAALTDMGGSRTRGPGEVRCKLEEVNGMQARDLTAETLKLLSEGGHIEPAPASRENRPAAAVANLPMMGKAPECRLAFQIELRDAAIFPTLREGDANTVLTHDFIPGSVAQGILARRFIKQHGSATQRFQELFCSGNVLFLAANPILPGEPWSPASPFPLSVRRDKETDGWFDTALKEPPPEMNLAGARFTWCDGAKMERRQRQQALEVERDLHYHHQRAHDKRIQRAIGGEAKELEPYTLSAGQAGTLFVYESLRAGQVFCGEILGAEADLKELRTLLPDEHAGVAVPLGRSRGTQYGAGAWKWGRIGKIEAPRQIVAKGEQFLVTLLSPMVAVNECGHPVPRFPIEELGPAFTENDIATASTRVVWAGGYLSHQRMPRRQTPALAAGSVFAIRAAAEIDLSKASRHSYGLRIEEGFGRVHLSRIEKTEHDLFTPLMQKEDQQAPRFAAKPTAIARNTTEWNIGVSILRDQIEDRAKTMAFRMAQETRRADRVNNHLLYRLIRVLEVRGLRGFEDEIKGLRKKAHEQLESGRVGGRTMSGYLLDTVGAPGRLLEEACNSPSAREWQQALGVTVAEAVRGSTFADKLCRGYLMRYLGALAALQREKRNAK